MARGSFFAGMMKSGALAALLVAGAAAPGYAGDPTKLTFTGSAVITTDYMFRSISNTNQNPEVAVEFDATYGMFWAYIWSSNTAFGENIEIDYGGGISPKWGPVTFTLGFLEYTYPGDGEFNRLFRSKGRCVLDHRRVDPCPQRLLVAGQFPALWRVQCNRWNAHLCLDIEAMGLLRAQHQRPIWIPVVPGDCRRLHLLECGLDSRLPGALVC